MNERTYLILLLFLCHSFTFFCKSNYIISKRSSINIRVDENSDDLIKWAANDLKNDINDILGTKIEIKYSEKYNDDSQNIYIGQFDDELINNHSIISPNHFVNKWENYVVKIYENDLFIIGSDVRGTVYGIFEIAERIGISPWKWWADVTPLKNDTIKLTIGEEGIEEMPSVQYRGIFLNDEDWGLQPWAAQTFEPKTNDIGPKTYEKIFQLLLRLKANTIWPAMHPSTKAFFTIRGNKEIAEKYHIIIGTSHAEPMLRNNVDEWNVAEYGEYNYFTNSHSVKQYWQERVTETKNGKFIYTLGMRGIHDSGMKGNASHDEQVKILKKIIDDQREMLTKTLNKPLENIPQVLVPYKEVLSLYNSGLNIPDDVTLMWTDDNYGYIRRFSNSEEQMRSGGSGVYYHVSYWGRPHDYLWLSTTQPGLIWYEMTRAYENGAQKIWIVNVGDIKPAEYNMEFFLDLAWDINSINEKTIYEHLHDWSKREFGERVSQKLANLFQEYYRLAFLRKPEFMGWSQTEPTTQTRISEFTIDNNNELQRRIDSYQNLYNKVDQIKAKIPIERHDAFFQLVEYPVKCSALMNYKFLFAQQAFLSVDKNERNIFNKKAEKAFNKIKELTKSYNSDISNGKWENMMSMSPRNLPVYEMPSYHLSELQTSKESIEFRNPSSPIFFPASNFKKCFNTDGYKWEIIEGLGYSNSSVTLSPFIQHKFEDSVPYVLYSFNIESTGKYEFQIRCLPTHSNNYDHKLWIEVDDKLKNEVSLNTKGRSEEWKRNVLRNFVSVNYPIEFEATGIHTLKIFINQTGIVLDQIAIIPEGYEMFYEIVNE